LTEEEEMLGARYGVLPLSRAMGCKRCGNSGYRGRLPLIEVAVITPALADMIAGGTTAHALQRAAIAQGMAPLRDVAVARVRRGETTLQEVERVIGDQIEDQTQQESGPPAILVVNADPAWRRMARALLEGGGFRVVEAVDASQAMQLMGTGEDFALMVTDLMMPALMQPALPQQHRVPALRPTTAIPIPLLPPAQQPEPAPNTPPAPSSERESKNVDWARYVQSTIRRTEH
jgi:hypothetical protein